MNFLHIRVKIMIIHNVVKSMVNKLEQVLRKRLKILRQDCQLQHLNSPFVQENVKTLVIII
jgi:hypothetical protein